MCVCFLALFLLERCLKEGWGLADWVRKELIDSVRPAHLTDEVTVGGGGPGLAPGHFISLILTQDLGLLCHTFLKVTTVSGDTSKFCFYPGRCVYICKMHLYFLLHKESRVTSTTPSCYRRSIYIYMCVCLTVPCGMWDLSYLTKDQSCIPCSGSSEF